jgi:hypothetical protein
MRMMSMNENKKQERTYLKCRMRSSATLIVKLPSSVQPVCGWGKDVSEVSRMSIRRSGGMAGGMIRIRINEGW